MSTAKKEAFIWSNIPSMSLDGGSRGSFRIDNAGVTIRIGDAYAEPADGEPPHPAITLSHSDMAWLAQHWQSFMWTSHSAAMKRQQESEHDA